VKSVLGEGGMGVVYEAFDQQRGHRVALKTVREPGPETIYRLKREFRTLADISHPNIVQLFDLVVGEGSVSYSMEVVDGVDLVSYCRRGGALHAGTSLAYDGDLDATPVPTRCFDEARLRACLRQLASGLCRLHAAGLVHRDIKPSNALVTREGRVVVLDLGLAASRIASDKDSMQGLVGTIAYMAPEQAAEIADVGPAADWYSVGAMLYEVLTGQLPHDGGLMEVLVAKRSVDPPRPSTIALGVPADLDDLCMALLARAPADRPDDAAVVARVEGAVVRRSDRDLPSTSNFTGRAAELEALDAAVATVVSGTPTLVWARGPSGIGKSALIGEALSRISARTPDAVILRGRCYEQELVPFKAIDGLIDGLSRLWRRMNDGDAAAILPRNVGALQRLFPVLARVPVVAEAPSGAESRDPLEMRARAFAALRELLQRLADRRLVVLFLDDLQWVDADTLLLLEELLRPPEPPRVLVVVSTRSESPNPGLEAVIGRMGVAVTRLDLEPLTDADARQLVIRLLGDRGAGLAERVVREAAGIPFFLGELVRYLQTAGDDIGALAIGDVVRRRISLLPASARRLLELIAVAGEPLTLRELAAAARLAAEQVGRDVRALRVDHLVRAPGGHGDERVECYHDRIRSAILESMDAAARRNDHRALATALGNDASPFRLARHWAGAGDAPRAAVAAWRAADRAMSTFEFETACELYRMSLELGEHGDAERRELQVALAGALLNAGRSAQAAEMFLAAADGPDPMQRLELRRRSAEHFLNAGLIERGVEVLRGVLAEIDEDLPRSPRRVVALFAWNHLRLLVGGLGWRSRDPSQIPPRELLRLDCYISIGLSLGVVDTMTAAMYQAKGLVTALRLGEPARVFRILTLYTIFLLSLGGRSARRGQHGIARCAEVAAATGDPFQLAYVDTVRGFGEYFAGRYESADRHLADAERRYQEETTGTTAELNHARVFRCHVLRAQGRFKDLRARCDEYMRDAHRRGDQYVKSTLHRAFALIFLADDDVDGARQALAAAWWSPPEKGFHLQHWYAVRAQVEVALYTGAIDVAELVPQLAQLRGSRLVRVQTVRVEAEWLQMRIALAAGEGGTPWSAARTSAQLRSEGLPNSEVLADLGSAALAAGQERIDLLDRVARRAEELAMYGCALAARWRLAEARNDAAALEAARTQFAAHGVIRPERMVEVLAPGFGSEYPRSHARR